MESRKQDISDAALIKLHEESWVKGRAKWNLPEQIEKMYPSVIPAHGYVTAEGDFSTEKALITLDTFTVGHAMEQLTGISAKEFRERARLAREEGVEHIPWFFHGTGHVATSLIYEPPNPEGDPVAETLVFPWGELRDEQGNYNKIKGVDMVAIARVGDSIIGIFSYEFAATKIPEQYLEKFEVPESGIEKLLERSSLERAAEFQRFRDNGYKCIRVSDASRQALEARLSAKSNKSMSELAKTEEVVMRDVPLNGWRKDIFGGYTLATMSVAARNRFKDIMEVEYAPLLGVVKFSFDKRNYKGDRYEAQYDLLYTEGGIGVVSVSYILKKGTKTLQGRELERVVSHGVFLVGNGKQLNQDDPLVREPLRYQVVPYSRDGMRKFLYGKGQVDRMRREDKLLRDQNLFGQ